MFRIFSLILPDNILSRCRVFWNEFVKCRYMKSSQYFSLSNVQNTFLLYHLTRRHWVYIDLKWICEWVVYDIFKIFLVSCSEYLSRSSPDKILSRCSHSWDRASRNWQFVSSEYCLPLKIQFPGVKKISQREIRLVIFYKYYKIKVFVMLSDSFLDDLQPSMVQKYEVPTTFIFKFLLFALEENHKYLLHHKSKSICYIINLQVFVTS